VKKGKSLTSLEVRGQPQRTGQQPQGREGEKNHASLSALAAVGRDTPPIS